VNGEFQNAIRETIRLFDTLDSQQYLVKKDLRARLDHQGVYVMYENETPVYVGRTRKLGRRIAGHRSGSRYSSTFTLRTARLSWSCNHPSQRMTTRILMQDVEFVDIFKREVRRVSGLRIKFIECEHILTQYLLEAYAIVELGLDQKELATH
jgi:hypothetical protein